MKQYSANRKTVVQSNLRITGAGFAARALTLLAVCAGAWVAQAQFIMTNIWTIGTNGTAPYTYINNDSSQRGIAYNATTNHVYVVSRTGSAQVYILDGDTGAHIGQLDVTGVAGGGGGAINLVDCTADGQIYICNLATTVNTFRLYRYTNENSAPVLVFLGDPTLGDTNAIVTNTKRFGDNMNLRGTGTNVQVLLHSRGGRASGLLFPIDDTMNSFTNQTILTDAPNNTIGLGAAFASGNSFWSKAPSQNLRRFNIVNQSDIYNSSINLVATTAVNVALSPITTSGLDTLVESNLLAVVDYAGATLRLYNTNVVLQDTKSFQPPIGANGNGTAEAAFGNRGGGTNYLFAVDSNNGILAVRLIQVLSPVVGTSPANTTILDGGYGSLTAVANGSSPLVYRWVYTNNNTTVGVFTNNGTFNLTNVTAATAGGYVAIVTNAAGSATSAVAVVTITPNVRTPAMTRLWTLPAGSRSYLDNDNNHRGFAYNPATGHILIVSRTGGIKIHVLDATTGTNLWEMNTDPGIITGAAPGGFELNMIGVADDGVVYACNLNTGGINSKVYRWDDDSTNSVPVAISSGDPVFNIGRYGDSMAVRGAGADTLILMRAQASDQSIFLRTVDGTNFASVFVFEDATDGNRLGVTFGAGNTYWSKGVTNVLHFAFDLGTATATTLQSFSTAVFPHIGYPLAVDPVNDLLAQVAMIGQTPDNLRLYDILDAANTNAPPLDTEFFGSDNANINGVGQAAFDVKGGRVFALDSNNGLIANKVVARLKVHPFANGTIVNWTGPSTLQSATSVLGPYTDIVTTSPYTNTAANTLFLRLKR